MHDPYFPAAEIASGVIDVSAPRAIARLADLKIIMPTNDTRTFSFSPEVVVVNGLDPKELHASLPHLEFCMRPIGTLSGNDVKIPFPNQCFESSLLGTHAPLNLVLPLDLANEGFILQLSLRDGVSEAQLKGSDTVSSIPFLKL